VLSSVDGTFLSNSSAEQPRRNPDASATSRRRGRHAGPADWQPSVAHLSRLLGTHACDFNPAGTWATRVRIRRQFGPLRAAIPMQICANCHGSPHGPSNWRGMLHCMSYKEPSEEIRAKDISFTRQLLAAGEISRNLFDSPRMKFFNRS